MGKSVSHQYSISFRAVQLGERPRVIRKTRVANNQGTVHIVSRSLESCGVDYSIMLPQQEDAMAKVEAKLDVHLEGLGSDHPASQAAMDELLSDLKSVTELEAEEREANSDGSKGVMVELVVSLGAPGSIAGLARIMQLWLGRDMRRSLTVSVRNAGKETVVAIEGDHISADAVVNALRSAVELKD